MKRAPIALFVTFLFCNVITLHAQADEAVDPRMQMILDYYGLKDAPAYRYPDSRESLDYAARELVIERAVSERMGGYAAPSNGSINWGDLAGRATNRALIENSIEHQRGLDRGR